MPQTVRSARDFSLDSVVSPRDYSKQFWQLLLGGRYGAPIAAYHADYETTDATAGTSILLDQSGNGNDAVQPTSQTPFPAPARENSMGGRTAFNFTATTQYWLTPALDFGGAYTFLGAAHLGNGDAAFFAEDGNTIPRLHLSGGSLRLQHRGSDKAVVVPSSNFQTEILLALVRHDSDGLEGAAHTTELTAVQPRTDSRDIPGGVYTATGTLGAPVAQQLRIGNHGGTQANGYFRQAVWLPGAVEGRGLEELKMYLAMDSGVRFSSPR